MEVAKGCLSNGVAVVPSAVFYPENTAAPAALRLNFSNASEADLMEGVKRLRQSLSLGKLWISHS